MKGGACCGIKITDPPLLVCTRGALFRACLSMPIVDPGPFRMSAICFALILCSIACTIGRRYTIVLPLPVGAQQITSSPANASGNAPTWVLVGATRSIPSASKPAKVHTMRSLGRFVVVQSTMRAALIKHGHMMDTDQRTGRAKGQNRGT